MAITKPIWFPDSWSSSQNLRALTSDEMSLGFPGGNDQRPTRQMLNRAIQFASNGNLYQLQNGLPAWGNQTQYGPGAIVRYGGEFYRALVQSIGAVPSTSNQWEMVSWSPGQPFLKQAWGDARFALASDSALLVDLPPLIVDFMPRDEFMSGQELVQTHRIAYGRTPAAQGGFEIDGWSNDDFMPWPVPSGTWTFAEQMPTTPVTVDLSRFPNVGPADLYYAFRLVSSGAWLGINITGLDSSLVYSLRLHTVAGHLRFNNVYVNSVLVGQIDYRGWLGPAANAGGDWHAVTFETPFAPPDAGGIINLSMEQVPPGMMPVNTYTPYLCGLEISVGPRFPSQELADARWLKILDAETIYITPQQAADEIHREDGETAIRAYSTTRTYALGTLAYAGEPSGRIYRSLIDNNQGNPLTDATSWERWKLPTTRAAHPPYSNDGRFLRGIQIASHWVGGVEWVVTADMVPEIYDFPDGMNMLFIMKGAGGDGYVWPYVSSSSEGAWLEVVMRVTLADFPMWCWTGDTQYQVIYGTPPGTGEAQIYCGYSARPISNPPLAAPWPLNNFEGLTLAAAQGFNSNGGYGAAVVEGGELTYVDPTRQVIRRRSIKGGQGSSGNSPNSMLWGGGVYGGQFSREVIRDVGRPGRYGGGGGAVQMALAGGGGYIEIYW